MKIYKFTVIFLLAVFIAAGFVLSCSDQDGIGTLVINLPGKVSDRAVLSPDQIDDLELSYKILFDSPAGSGTINGTAGESITLNVAAGTWNITVKVLHAETVEIGEQTKTQIVVKDKITPVFFSIPIKMPTLYIDVTGNITGITKGRAAYHVKIFPNNMINNITDFDSHKESDYLAYGDIYGAYDIEGDPNPRKFLLRTSKNNIWEGNGAYTVVLVREQTSDAPYLVRMVKNVGFAAGKATILFSNLVTIQ